MRMRAYDFEFKLEAPLWRIAVPQLDLTRLALRLMCGFHFDPRIQLALNARYNTQISNRLSVSKFNDPLLGANLVSRANGC